ncbi:hypothetical protein Pd630_LPD01424 [Rhodococcus opacus PD630]|nr:hypothetical protein Pd630_LPD01424 [Rhodococcus opacus PD630]
MPRRAPLSCADLESHPELKLFVRWISPIQNYRFPNTS